MLDDVFGAGTHMLRFFFKPVFGVRQGVFARRVQALQLLLDKVAHAVDDRLRVVHQALDLADDSGPSVGHFFGGVFEFGHVGLCVE